MKYIAAIDQGTSSTRFIVFDHQGQIAAVDQKEHKQYYPQSGQVEHDPMEIWIRTQEVILNALQKSGIHPSEISALGITNQRETTVMWDRNTGQPLHPAIVWQDTRTDGICQELARKGGQDRLRDKTGLLWQRIFPVLRSNGYRKCAFRSRCGKERHRIGGTIDTWLI
jgi:glycerol kinase